MLSPLLPWRSRDRARSRVIWNSGRKVGGVFRGAAVPIVSAFELRQTARGDVRGRTTGAVEVYHAVCLLFTGEPLRPPLTSVVGGLVTDFEAHGVVCLVWKNSTGSAGDDIACGVQCACRHTADRFQRTPESVSDATQNQQFKHQKFAMGK
jgi:ABC-type enterobactin transport system permease subunit